MKCLTSTVVSETVGMSRLYALCYTELQRWWNVKMFWCFVALFSLVKFKFDLFFVDLKVVGTRTHTHTHAHWHLPCADHVPPGVLCLYFAGKLDVHSFHPGAESPPCPSVSHSTLILSAQPSRSSGSILLCLYKSSSHRGFGRVCVCVCQQNKSRAFFFFFFSWINQPTQSPYTSSRYTVQTTTPVLFFFL